MKGLHWLRLGLLVLATMIAAGLPAAAQGLQTGVITGTISSSDGLSLPGATVSAQRRRDTIRVVEVVVRENRDAHCIAQHARHRFDVFQPPGPAIRLEPVAAEAIGQGFTVLRDPWGVLAAQRARSVEQLGGVQPADSPHWSRRGDADVNCASSVVTASTRRADYEKMGVGRTDRRGLS